MDSLVWCSESLDRISVLLEERYSSGALFAFSSHLVIQYSSVCLILILSWMTFTKFSRSSSLLFSSILSTASTLSTVGRSSRGIATVPSLLQRTSLLPISFLSTTAMMMSTTSASPIVSSNSISVAKEDFAKKSFTATGKTVEVDIPNHQAHSYTDIPSSLHLDKLIIFHRHGDRAQIARSLGQNYPEDPQLAEIWKQALPSEDSLQAMRYVARHELLSNPVQNVQERETYDWKELYTGWDKKGNPYGQLTDIGVKQLIQVGQHLQQRYSTLYPHIIPSTLKQAKQQLYCRSTNICRTIQSLRGLLAGMFFHEISPKLERNPGQEPTATTSSTSSSTTTLTGTSSPAAAIDSKDDEEVPLIVTRARNFENMFPQVDGECFAMAHRRSVIFPPTLLAERIAGYDRIEKKMRLTLGFPSVEKGHSSKVNWFNVKEIFTCHLTHGIQQLQHLDPEDEAKATEIASWTWGYLYKDDILNRFAIGRFIRDVLQDIFELQKEKTCLIYSGHDSTLVPLLCALGVYDDSWPDYASNLILELASDKTTSQQYIRVIFNDEIMQVGKYPHTGSLYSAEDIPVMSTKYDGWYDLHEVVRYLYRLEISNDQYQVEKLKVTSDDLDADEEALVQNRNDLSATVATNGNK